MILKTCSEAKLIEAEDFQKDKTTGKLTRRKSKFLTANVDTCLPTSILLAEGARVMLIKNEDVNDGLVNGIMGTVVSIPDYSPHVLPKVIYIHFDSENVGKNSKLQRVIEQKRCVGLTPSKEDIPMKSGTRKQFPLQLAWACTVHKVQGLTVKECVISLNRSFTYGQAYVALSRVTSKSGLHIKEIEDKKLNDKIYCDPDIAKGVTSMEKYLLENTAKGNGDENVFTIMYHNIQGLQLHLEDLQQNPDFSDADYICLTETWLESMSSCTNLRNYEFRHISRSEAYDSENAFYKSLKEMQHGGVGVFFRKASKFDKVEVPVTNLECIIFRIPDVNVVVATMYRAQKYPLEKFMDNLSALLAHLTTLCDKLILLGDFNQDLSKGERSLETLLRSKGFKQHVQNITTEAGTLIDHVYAKGQLDVQVSVIPAYYSYHEAIAVLLKGDTD